MHDIKEITILSGKGGTGKTTITASLASIAKNAVICDIDVDAADLFLLLKPDIQKQNIFESGWQLTINADHCFGCGICEDLCEFDAIHNINSVFQIDSFKCEGCRLCERICPAETIGAVKKKNNFWYISKTRFGCFVHATMGPGEENSGRLVTKVRTIAKEIAQKNNNDYIISDGPPGIGCPVIASLSCTQVVLLVIEPTQSGLHDAKRLIKLIKSFNIKMFAVINKYDINIKVTELIQIYLKQKRIPLIEKIPFNSDIVKAMIQEKTIVEYQPNIEISYMIRHIWQTLNHD